MNAPEDLGPPAVELRELLTAPDPVLLGRIRGSIHRRLFVSDSADFAFRVFFETLFDYLDLIMRGVTGAARPSGKEQD
ncbi:MAG: hypothetical protein R3D98_15205 [Candidatus Krumholzibacteriia bacterium]